VISFAGELLGAAEALLRDGLHTSEVADGYGKAAAKARASVANRRARSRQRGRRRRVCEVRAHDSITAASAPNCCGSPTKNNSEW